jgi:hypothetical protein
VHAPEQGHNYNLDRVALNYPCLISRLRIVRHIRTKCRENGTYEQHYIFSFYRAYAGHNAPFGPQVGIGTPTGAKGPAIDVS